MQHPTPPTSSPPVGCRVRTARTGPGLGLLLPVALAALGLGAPQVAGQEGAPEDARTPAQALSLAEALAQAAATNPDVRIPREEISAAQWSLRSARANLLPSLSVGSGVSWQGGGEQRLGGLTAGQLGISEQPSWLFSSWDVGLSLNLSGSAILAPREADAGLVAARARVGAAEAALILDVTRAYLGVLRNEEGVRLARQELDRAEVNLELAEGRVAVGAATPLDARQAQVAVGRARVALVRAEGELRNAGIDLLTLLGEPEADREVRLTTRFPVAEPMALEEGALVSLALDGNPDLRSLQAQLDRSRVAHRSARTAYLPTLQLSAGWSGFSRRAVEGSFLVDQARTQSEALVQQCLQSNDILSRLTEPMPPTNCGQFTFREEDRQRILEENRAFPLDFTRQPPSASLSISLPVFQGLQRQRQVETARVERESARLRTEERTRGVRGDVIRQVTTVRTALEAAQIEEENREVAEAQLELAREQYEVGMVDFLQLAEAEAVLARAERERLDAIYGYHEALAALEALVGVPLRIR
jgi:outer membrane protein